MDIHVIISAKRMKSGYRYEVEIHVRGCSIWATEVKILIYNLEPYEPDV